MRTIGLIGISVAVGALAACSSSSTPATSGDAGNHEPHADAQVADSSGKDAGAKKDTGTTKTDAGSKDSGTEVDAKGSSPDAHTADSSDKADTGTTTSDAGDKADAAPADEQLLITFGGETTSELVSVNVATAAVSGRLQFAGVGMTNATNPTMPFLLEQNADILAQLNPAKPWTVASTWNVLVPPPFDGGAIDSDPYSVVVQAAGKAYVLLYERNEIAVINPSTAVDGGAPSSTIDLSHFVQTGNSDGLVEMTAAAYVPSSQRLYVVLANINQTELAQYGGVICDGEVASVVAIDTTNDTIVSLGGSGPGGSIALTYAAPIDVVYDGAGGRLLIVGSGCYEKPATVGGALGAGTQIGVEQIELSTGKDSSLLAINASDFPAGFVDVPTGFAYIDSTHAIIGFDQTGQAVYNWNPTTTSIGAVIPNAPDVFTYDGHGHLLGTRMDTSDAGIQTNRVVSVAVATGQWTSLGTNVTSLTGTTYVASVDVWPHP